MKITPSMIAMKTRPSCVRLWSSCPFSFRRSRRLLSEKLFAGERASRLQHLYENVQRRWFFIPRGS